MRAAKCRRHAATVAQPLRTWLLRVFTQSEKLPAWFTVVPVDVKQQTHLAIITRADRIPSLKHIENSRRCANVNNFMVEGQMKVAVTTLMIGMIGFPAAMTFAVAGGRTKVKEHLFENRGLNEYGNSGPGTRRDRCNTRRTWALCKCSLLVQDEDVCSARSANLSAARPYHSS